ncbi:polyribonucleotide nucleotidyltransferase [bacterium]|nr:polyribonucleotide nucleotidyltransferase [Candidatus Elulimicrobium humile]
MDFKIYQTQIAGQNLKVEIGKLAKQANGSVMVSLGETTVLVTAVMSDKPANSNYLPLFVDYQEKFYANNKIKGSRFVKREGKPSDDSILTGRLVDRAIRPFFDQSIRNEIQVVVTTLSMDDRNDPDAVALFGASLALSISDIPWYGPVAALRVASVGGEIIVNPSFDQREAGDFDTIITLNSENRLVMMEFGGKQIPETVVLEAFNTVSSEINKMIQFQNNIISKIGVAKRELSQSENNSEIIAGIKNIMQGKLESIVYGDSIATQQAQSQLVAELNQAYPEHNNLIEQILDKALNQVFKAGILEKDIRPDGRALDEIRELSAEIDILPRVHSSALFNRGATQTLSILTLGSPGEAQIIDEMKDEIRKRFMHHYNFPPFSVGEVGQLRGPGRREIGHGALVEKALEGVLPNIEDFPYTIRIVTEVLGSNGSSSMASVCSSTLALLAAGVPILASVAGIAMGIVEQDGKYKILTDIQGLEDHFGEMDFKVAGTRQGVNAIQMDIKGQGMSMEMLVEALEDARVARMTIIDTLARTINEPRAEVSKYAPKIEAFMINPNKIRDVIGVGGKIINAIIDETGVKIDIEDNGQVFVTGEDMAQVKQATDKILELVYEPKEGDVFDGKVVKIMPFGAFINIKGNIDGLIHISELSDKYINSVEDVIQLNQSIRVKIKKIDIDGKISLIPYLE